MARTVKPKIGMTVTARSVRKALVKQSHKQKSQKSAKVYYKTADIGTDEQDLIHILVPDFYAGSKIINPISVKIGDSINTRLKGTGIVVTGVQVGKMRKRTSAGRIIETKVGRVVLSIDRDSVYTTQDVVKSIQAKLFPQIRLGNIKFVASAADLPGESTGPGPGPRPPK